jgi:hypothetical protein
VLAEIQERRQWLDDMIALGNGEKYKRQIQNEIAIRIKRMEILDKTRQKSCLSLGSKSGPPLATVASSAE